MLLPTQLLKSQSGRLQFPRLRLFTFMATQIEVAASRVPIHTCGCTRMAPNQTGHSSPRMTTETTTPRTSAYLQRLLSNYLRVITLLEQAIVVARGASEATRMGTIDPTNLLSRITSYLAQPPQLPQLLPHRQQLLL